MGMRFTNEGNDRFATVVGGRPGGKGGRPVAVPSAVRGFLERLFDDPEARRAFLADPDAAAAADPALAGPDRATLRAIPPEKVRAIEAMIPAAAAPRRAPVIAAAVTALAVFLGLATPALAQNPSAVAPGGIRPDLESDGGAHDRFAPETGIRPGPAVDGEIRMPITKGIRPDPDVVDLDIPGMDVTRGIRPDLDPDPADDDIRFDRPVLPEGTSEVVTPGTGEVDLAKTVEAGLEKPPGKPAAPFHIDRPNVTRGIRPKF